MINVLITGMNGLIGGILKEQLESEGGYNISSLQRSNVDGANNFQGDIADIESIRPAFVNQDVVVHLAAHLGDSEWSSHLQSNIIGTFNVFEAARLEGVKRVVFASSGRAASGFERMKPYSDIISGNYSEVTTGFQKVTGQMVRPEGLYGAVKAWGEGLACHFADAYQMSMICVRIGLVRPVDRPTDARSKSVHVSHRDIGRFFQKCIDAPERVNYEILFATSKNKWSYRDISAAKEIIGFEPLDSADDFEIET